MTGTSIVSRYHMSTLHSLNTRLSSSVHFPLFVNSTHLNDFSISFVLISFSSDKLPFDFLLSLVYDLISLWDTSITTIHEFELPVVTIPYFSLVLLAASLFLFPLILMIVPSGSAPTPIDRTKWDGNFDFPCCTLRKASPLSFLKLNPTSVCSVCRAVRAVILKPYYHWLWVSTLPPPPAGFGDDSVVSGSLSPLKAIFSNCMSSNLAVPPPPLSSVSSISSILSAAHLDPEFINIIAFVGDTTVESLISALTAFYSSLPPLEVESETVSSISTANVSESLVEETPPCNSFLIDNFTPSLQSNNVGDAPSASISFANHSVANPDLNWLETIASLDGTSVESIISSLNAVFGPSSLSVVETSMLPSCPPTDISESPSNNLSILKSFSIDSPSSHELNIVDSSLSSAADNFINISAFLDTSILPSSSVEANIAPQTSNPLSNYVGTAEYDALISACITGTPIADITSPFPFLSSTASADVISSVIPEVPSPVIHDSPTHDTSMSDLSPLSTSSLQAQREVIYSSINNPKLSSMISSFFNSNN